MIYPGTQASWSDRGRSRQPARPRRPLPVPAVHYPNPKLPGGSDVRRGPARHSLTHPA